MNIGLHASVEEKIRLNDCKRYRTCPMNKRKKNSLENSEYLQRINGMHFSFVPILIDRWWIDSNRVSQYVFFFFFSPSFFRCSIRKQIVRRNFVRKSREKSINCAVYTKHTRQRDHQIRWTLFHIESTTQSNVVLGMFQKALQNNQMYCTHCDRRWNDENNSWKTYARLDLCCL